MNKQLIITIGRECSSGGQWLAQRLSKILDLPLYNRKLISDVSFEDAEKYDEKPVNVFISRRLGAFSNSLEENLAMKQFSLIKKMADEGKSFIVVGRCAEYILKDNPNVLKVFITADLKDRIERSSSYYNISKEEAKKYILKKDKQRKTYHDYYCENEWGDARNYDLTLNTSKLDLFQCEDIIKLAIGKKEADKVEEIEDTLLIAQIIINKCKYKYPLTNSKIQKLMYFAQKESMEEFGFPIFKEDIVAYPCGPGIESVNHYFTWMNKNNIPIKLEEKTLPERVIKIIDRTLEKYAKIPTEQLAKKTQKEEPWIKVWNNGQGKDLPIPLDYLI